MPEMLPGLRKPVPAERLQRALPDVQGLRRNVPNVRKFLPAGFAFRERNLQALRGDLQWLRRGL